MKCPRCQAENPLGMRFCGQCAAPLADANGYAVRRGRPGLAVVRTVPENGVHISREHSGRVTERALTAPASGTFWRGWGGSR